jgi:hypothetical protein
VNEAIPRRRRIDKSLVDLGLPECLRSPRAPHTGRHRAQHVAAAFPTSAAVNKAPRKQLKPIRAHKAG